MADYIFQRRIHLRFYILFYHVTLALPHVEVVQLPCHCIKWASTNRVQWKRSCKLPRLYHNSNVPLSCLLVTNNTHIWSSKLFHKKSNNPEVAMLWRSQAMKRSYIRILISNPSVKSHSNLGIRHVSEQALVFPAEPPGNHRAETPTPLCALSESLTGRICVHHKME